MGWGEGVGAHNWGKGWGYKRKGFSVIKLMGLPMNWEREGGMGRHL